MKEEIKSLTPIEHILARPSMYISSTKIVNNKEWLLSDSGALEYKDISYVPALVKIINEAIDNSVDAGTKTNWKYSTKISVSISEDTVTVEDNGTGIPTSKNEEGEYQCVNAVCKPMSGSNFEDDDTRNSIGVNGIGIKAANIFSSYFECVTTDKHSTIKIVCKDNLSKKKVTELTHKEKTGTKISFKPDFSKFETDKLDENVATIIKTRLRFLSWFYPECSFTFNGEKMNMKAKEMSSMFPSPAITLNNSDVYICVYPADEGYSLSYVNGISLRRGGTHVDYIINKLSGDIRDKVSKKYKTIKPADIKNRLGIVVFFKGFTNCLFDSQTKETLTNAQGDISNYLKSKDVDLDKLSQKVLKEKEIIDNITEIFQLKEDLKEKKELAKLNTKKKDIDSVKYVPPIGNKKYLCITEGQSAYGGIAPTLGRKGIGYYQIQGKILNVQNLSLKKALENTEISDLVNILGVDLSNPESDIEYEKIIISSDSDSDGSHISALLTVLFHKICPKIIKENRLCRLNTPLLAGVSGVGKSRKIVKYFFTLPDQSTLDKRLTWIYQKGLGGWGGENAILLKQVIEKEGSLENLLMAISLDKESNSSLENWMGDRVDYRKNALRGKEFHIDMM